MTLRAIAGAASFAHLLGRSAKSKSEDSVPDPKEVDDGTGCEGDDKDPEDKDDKDKDARRAEGDDKDPEDKDDKDKDARRAEGDDKDPEDKDDKDKEAKGKGARADDEGDDGESGDDEGDDESDDTDMRKKGSKSARLRERARCAAIFGDAAAGKNPALAARLAFNTSLPRSQAIACLQDGSALTAAAPRRASLDERMARVAAPKVGASDPSPARPGGASLSDQIIAAGKRRRGEA